MPQDTELSISDVAPHCTDLTLVKKIGRGGQKEVFLATDSSNKKVVVKLIKIDYMWVDNQTIMRDTESETRAEREIALMKKYTSPYLPSLYNQEPKRVVINGYTYIYFVENHAGEDSVADLIQANSTMPEDSVLAMVRDVSTALELYRADKIVHRDVKPQNIVYDSTNDRYVLIDGGVHLSPQNTTLSVGYIAGTEPYYSPEQASGERRGLDSRSDLFALGVTAYQALTGYNPFAIGVTNMDEFNKNRANATYPLLVAGLFREQTRRVIHKLLEKYPHNRHRNPALLLLEFKEEE